MDLSSELGVVKGVGKKTAEQFELAGLKTVKDLIEFFPRTYEDFSRVTTIASIKPGKVSLRGHFENARTRRVRRAMTVTEATLVDKTGKVAVVWFNQAYRVKQVSEDKEFLVSGEFGLQRNKYQLVSPSVERVEGENISVGRIVPIYRQVSGLKTQLVRKVLIELKPYILALDETLPAELLRKEKLMSYADAVMALHFPENDEDLAGAKDRLGFEELLSLMLASLKNRADNDALKSHSVKFDAADARRFVGNLPFELTKSQRIAAWEAIQDLEGGKPMNRLLQGDVGSGKTVVAGLVAHIAARAGLQTAFMAPTELLANQHAETLLKLLSPFDTKVALLTGSVKGKARQQLYEHVENGAVDVLVGTHALIQDKVKFHKLGFVVIDEQHRFGVEQRNKLLAKSSGLMPHLLAMTATPIPRSLQLTVYGELDVSILSEKPKNRLPIKTDIISPNSRAQMYDKVEKEIEAGHQVYVVCPLIRAGDWGLDTGKWGEAQKSQESQETPTSERTTSSVEDSATSQERGAKKMQLAPSGSETEDGGERGGEGAYDASGDEGRTKSEVGGLRSTDSERRSVEAEVKRLRQGPFKHRQIGMLHGKMKSDEKQCVMAEFASGKTDILVSTTVVEVGVDVPNATVMIIEGADTFGLAQLHQLRGRVGRAEWQSYCYLVPSTSQQPSRRLRELERSNDGFYLAEKDLEIRGPGEIYGRAQHGQLNLNFARITDTRLLHRVQKAARSLQDTKTDLLQYKQLAAAVEHYRRLTTLN